MLNEIIIGNIRIPTFPVCAVVGILAMLLLIFRKLYTTDNRKNDAFICIRVVIAFAVGYVGALLMDSLFKIVENGGFQLGGMTFYGGMIFGVPILALLLRFKNNSGHGVSYWLDFLSAPFVLFHAFGRLGCFLGGCCYGKTTDSIFGLYFPDLPSHNIFHNGQKCFPTQLYEMVGLLIIFVVLTFFIKKYKFTIYAGSYAVMRFMIEFLRGDDRGNLFGWVLSPAQVISLAIMAGVIGYVIYKVIHKHNGDITDNNTGTTAET